MAALDLTVGQTAKRSSTITAEHVHTYAEITGDRNPLHFDEGFVSRTKVGRLVVHGGLISGILNALVAEDMPGPGTVFMNMELQFLKPVFIGDTITATAEVLEVHPSKPICKLDVAIVRDDGENGAHRDDIVLPHAAAGGLRPLRRTGREGGSPDRRRPPVWRGPWPSAGHRTKTVTPITSRYVTGDFEVIEGRRQRTARPGAREPGRAGAPRTP